jgi:SNF2 family DNA or RNA helicase
MGKTVTTLTALETFKRAGIGPALVVAPLRVCYEVWCQEAARWDHTQGLRFSLLHGTLEQRNAAARQDADVYLLNYDGLKWLDEQGWRWLARKPQVLVCDESTSLKSHRSRRFQLLRKMLPRFRRRYILTGTPAPNGLLDLWSQFFVLDGGKALGPYITRYRQAYFLPSGFGGHEWVLRPDAEREIYDKIRPLALHLSSLDHLDMPSLITQALWVKLPPGVREVYDEFEDQMLVELRNGTLTAANAAVMVNKLRQITSGTVYSDAGAEKLHSAKYDAVVEFVEGLAGQRALIAFEFRHERDALQSRLPGWPALDGETTPAITRRLVKGWNAGDFPGLLVHPQACGHGLNLQHGPGRHLLWTSGTWRLELAEQMVGRLWRQGQRQTVFVSRLMARDTIDAMVWRRVDQKDRHQRSLLEELKGGVR